MTLICLVLSSNSLIKGGYSISAAWETVKKNDDTVYTVNAVDTVDMVYTVDMACTVDMVYTIDMVYTADMVYTVYVLLKLLYALKD